MSGGSSERTRVAIAVNADSMATWFTAVLPRLPEVLFDIRIEDQDHSARLLREGAVMGAVTTERTAVPGCRVLPLGVMRYVPVAGPSYVERYLRDGFTADAVASAPSLAWNRDDALQDMLVRKAFRRSIGRPVHYVPTAEGFAVGGSGRAGLGNVPREPCRNPSGGRIVCPDIRRAPRCAVVLAVLEVEQLVGGDRHRCRGDGRR